MTRVASIDIGTNTILLLIAEWEDGKVRPLFDTETIVRLGEGVHRTRLLSREAWSRGLQTLTAYKERCTAMNVVRILAVGTSALREAGNSHEFISMIREQLDISIEVISGEEEALCSFLAVAKDLDATGKPSWVVDVGGGSTELILGRNGQVAQGVSLPLGAVRLTEQFLSSDPVREEEWQRMEEAIQKNLVNLPHPKEPGSLVAVGGTATTLAAVAQGLETFVAEKIHHFILTEEALIKQLHLYRSKTIEARKGVRGLPPARADVILAGAAILDGVMKRTPMRFATGQLPRRTIRRSLQEALRTCSRIVTDHRPFQKVFEHVIHDDPQRRYSQSSDRISPCRLTTIAFTGTFLFELSRACWAN